MLICHLQNPCDCLGSIYITLDLAVFSARGYISRTPFKHIRHLLPLSRGSARIGHYRFLNALPTMAGNACKWRSLRPVALGTRRLSGWRIQAVSLYPAIIKGAAEREAEK